MFATTNIVKWLLQVLFASANMDHMGNALSSGKLDAEVADILAAKMEELTISLRELSRRSGVKLTRLGDILRRGRPATVSEVNAIAAELGLIGWRVMQEAECRIGAGDCVEGAVSASAVSEPADSASLTGYRTKWVGVRDLPRFGPTPEEQERMAARLSDRGDLPDDWGEEPQA